MMKPKPFFVLRSSLGTLIRKFGIRHHLTHQHITTLNLSGVSCWVYSNSNLVYHSSVSSFISQSYDQRTQYEYWVLGNKDSPTLPESVTIFLATTAEKLREVSGKMIEDNA